MSKVQQEKKTVGSERWKNSICTYFTMILKHVRRKQVIAITFSTKISLSVLYNQKRILLYWGFINHSTQVFINHLVTDSWQIWPEATLVHSLDHLNEGWDTQHNYKDFLLFQNSSKHALFVHEFEENDYSGHHSNLLKLTTVRTVLS